ncbi:MAG: phosphatidylserine decarboxylase [Acidimicrobiia bacterium]|nr:phosphatidylserine decarboxylase [Acidimicrobiia bacterium]
MRARVMAFAGFFGLMALLVRAYERWFFPRDPARPIDPNASIVAPADGRIVYVAAVEEGKVPIAIKEKTEIPLDDIVKGLNRPPTGVLIGIFMSPFDVHYQRSPIAGIVKEVSYHPAPHNYVMGSMFLRNLFRIQPMHTRSPHIVANERNIIHVEGDGHDAYVVQIADQQVNKIDCYVAPGDAVVIGQKIGMIRRGSQVDLFLPGMGPEDLPALAVGQKLRAGESSLLALGPVGKSEF